MKTRFHRKKKHKRKVRSKCKGICFERGDSLSPKTERMVKMGVNLYDFVRRESRGKNSKGNTSDNQNFLHKIDNRVSKLSEQYMYITSR